MWDNWLGAKVQSISNISWNWIIKNFYRLNEYLYPNTNLAYQYQLGQLILEDHTVRATGARIAKKNQLRTNLSELQVPWDTVAMQILLKGLPGDQKYLEIDLSTPITSNALEVLGKFLISASAVRKLTLSFKSQTELGASTIVSDIMMQKICAALNHSVKIQHLELCNLELSTKSWELIYNLLAGPNNIQEIVIGGNFISAGLLTQLLLALQEQHLTTLNLGVEPKGYTTIGHLIRKKAPTPITTISVHFGILDYNALQILINFLKHDTIIKNLKLACTSSFTASGPGTINFGYFSNLMQALKSHQGINSLAINTANINNAQWLSLIEYLSQATSLQTLTLAGSHLSRHTLGLILEVLQDHPIPNFNLNRFFLNHEVVSKISGYLANGLPLESLTISNCKFTPTHLTTLAQAIASPNNKVKKLDLSYTSLGAVLNATGRELENQPSADNAGFKALFKALANNTVLTEVSLEHLGSNIIFFYAAKFLISKNTTLQKLILSNNYEYRSRWLAYSLGIENPNAKISPIPSRYIAELIVALKRNKTLRTLELADINFSVHDFINLLTSTQQFALNELNLSSLIKLFNALPHREYWFGSSENSILEDHKVQELNALVNALGTALTNKNLQRFNLMLALPPELLPYVTLENFTKIQAGILSHPYEKLCLTFSFISSANLAKLLLTENVSIQDLEYVCASEQDYNIFINLLQQSPTPLSLRDLKLSIYEPHSAKSNIEEAKLARIEAQHNASRISNKNSFYTFCMAYQRHINKVAPLPAKVKSSEKVLHSVGKFLGCTPNLKVALKA